MEEHPEAKFIVETLSKKGYIAYYAGGWVRDYLLQVPSDDIDIATNAEPEVVQNLFEKTVPIGLSFGIILVIIDERQYEVATFRKDLEYKDGRRPTKVAFATPQKDALRRDFTINGLFYDPIKEKILDFVEGQKDLEKKIIKAIGNPHERIREDRLRMIRAVRLSCRFNFSIEPDTEKAIIAHAKELFPAVAMERVVQEFYKMTAYPNFKKALIKLHALKLLEIIFPELKGVCIQTKLQAIEDFPKNAPLIAYLLELFEEKSLEEKLNLCKYLKLPNHDHKFTIFLENSKQLLSCKSDVENVLWAKFYAHPFSHICLLIYAAHLPTDKKKQFLLSHEERKKELLVFIQRIKEKKPLISSRHLKEKGIKPGKNMGELLEEAEKISINQNLQDPNSVIEKLQSSNLWIKEDA